MPSVIDVRALRRRTLYPGEVQGRVGTVHYSAKAAARQGNYRAAPGGCPMCLIAYRRQWSRGTAGTSERDGPRFANGIGNGAEVRRWRAGLCGGGGAGAGQTLAGPALRRGRSGDRSDADGPGFEERAERGQVRRWRAGLCGEGEAGAGQTLTGRAWRMGTGADGQTLTAWASCPSAWARMGRSCSKKASTWWAERPV